MPVNHYLVRATVLSTLLFNRCSGIEQQFFRWLMTEGRTWVELQSLEYRIGKIEQRWQKTIWEETPNTRPMERDPSVSPYIMRLRTKCVVPAPLCRASLLLSFPPSCEQKYGPACLYFPQLILLFSLHSLLVQPSFYWATRCMQWYQWLWGEPHAS